MLAGSGSEHLAFSHLACRTGPARWKLFHFQFSFDRCEFFSLSPYIKTCLQILWGKEMRDASWATRKSHEVRSPLAIEPHMLWRYRKQTWALSFMMKILKWFIWHLALYILDQLISCQVATEHLSCSYSASSISRKNRYPAIGTEYPFAGFWTRYIKEVYFVYLARGLICSVYIHSTKNMCASTIGHLCHHRSFVDTRKEHLVPPLSTNLSVFTNALDLFLERST